MSYTKLNSKHPFAIDVPTMDFELVAEKSAIGTEGDYPLLTQWVVGGCDLNSEYANWYKSK